MKQINSALGELIKAVGTNWFANTLPAVLQCAFQYDYYLLAQYERGHHLHIVRSDFRDVEMEKTLHYLVTETYVAEPIFRLFSADKTQGGIFDMAELTQQSLSLPEPVDQSSPHLITDGREEIGWRTVGWPEYQQETCILVPFGVNQLITVSLFNFGLSTTNTSSRENLDPLYPILASAIARHFELRTSIGAEQLHNPSPILNNTPTEHKIIGNDDVVGFFESVFRVTITTREAEIFTALLQGDTLAAISENLCISVYTAQTHRRNVYRKIGHGRLLELISQFHAHNSL